MTTRLRCRDPGRWALIPGYLGLFPDVPVGQWYTGPVEQAATGRPMRGLRWCSRPLLMPRGRELDGTPAIVEHRTGGHVTEPIFETDLYAVAGALAVRSDWIAVHIHRFGIQDGPECERVVYEADDLQAAEERLDEAAADALDEAIGRAAVGVLVGLR